MMSFTEDNLNFDLIDGIALETLIIASARTLKQGNMKYGREEVSKLVSDSSCNKFVRILLIKYWIV